MNISKNISKLSNKKKLHFSLLDPDKQNPKIAGTIAKTAEDAGSSAIMVGGSTLVSQEQVDETVKEIKKQSNLPVILFPSGSKFLSKYADAVFFMSLLNSRNLDYVIREHVRGAPFIKHTKLEPISMGYVIVEPGMTAGRVGEVDLVKVPGTKGSFAILKNHAPLISTLEKGQIKIVTPDEKESFIDIDGGMIEVKKNNIIILADNF